MTQRATRNQSIEMLRLIAVASIAIFHTFQAPFEEAVTCPGSTEISVFPFSALMGLFNQLGAFGNEIFFMISGYFLVESAFKAIGHKDYWLKQAERTISRLKKIILPTAFYCVLAYFVSRLCFHIPGIGEGTLSWLTTGLEFIWVYAATVVLAPLIAIIKTTLGQKRYRIAAISVIAIVITVNIYIAFISPNGERSILSWRKLMSAATYLCAFIAGDLLRNIIKRTNKQTRTLAILLLVSLSALLLATEWICAFKGRLDIIASLSYKSTSLFAFMGAFCSLWAAATSQSKIKYGPAIEKLASGTIGFYVIQSITSGIWRPKFQSILVAATASFTNETCSAIAEIITGIGLSLLFALLTLVIDVMRRKAALKAISMYSPFKSSGA